MIINIGRELGAGGREIGQSLAETLHLAYYDKELIIEAARQSGIHPRLFEQADEANNLFLCALGSRNAELFRIQSETIQRLAEQGNALFIGRCADYILRKRTDCINIFLTADVQDRVARLCKAQGITEKQAVDLIEKSDRCRAEYYDFYTNKRWGAARSYELCVNTSHQSTEDILQIILLYINHRIK